LSLSIFVHIYSTMLSTKRSVASLVRRDFCRVISIKTHTVSRLGVCLFAFCVGLGISNQIKKVTHIFWVRICCHFFVNSSIEFQLDPFPPRLPISKVLLQLLLSPWRRLSISRFIDGIQSRIKSLIWYVMALCIIRITVQLQIQFCIVLYCISPIRCTELLS
jgi:hypothetical protein